MHIAIAVVGVRVSGRVKAPDVGNTDVMAEEGWSGLDAAEQGSRAEASGVGVGGEAHVQGPGPRGHEAEKGGAEEGEGAQGPHRSKLTERAPFQPQDAGK